LRSCTRGLHHLEPDVGADGEQHDADQEAGPPAPGQELVVRQQPGQRERSGGQEQPARHPDVGGRAVEPTAFGGRVLDREQHRPAVLPADADALQDPEHDEQDRRPHPDRVVRRQQADQRRADSHDQQREQQHLLAADAVAEVTEDQAADRPGQEADGERAEPGELRRRTVQAVEVELVEDQAGGGPVEEEVVPLDRGTHRGRDRHPARRGSGGLLVGGGVGRGLGGGHAVPLPALTTN
jgi:hypothetical protein